MQIAEDARTISRVTSPRVVTSSPTSRARVSTTENRRWRFLPPPEEEEEEEKKNDTTTEDAERGGRADPERNKLNRFAPVLYRKPIDR